MAFKCKAYVENQDGPVEGNLNDGGILVFEMNFEVYLPFDSEQNKPTGSRRIAWWPHPMAGSPPLSHPPPILVGKKAGG